MQENIKKNIDEFFKRNILDKDTRLRSALAINLSSLKDMNTLKKMSKMLVVNLAEIAYIGRAEAFEVAEYTQQTFDYGMSFGLGVDTKVKGRTEETIGKLIIYFRRKTNKAIDEAKSDRLKAEDLEKDISLLMRGLADIVKCDTCEGSGIVFDDDDKDCTCWNCNGDRKVIQRKD